MVPLVSSTSVLQPQLVDVQVSRGSDALNLTLSNDAEVNASNISVNATLEGIAERKLFVLESLDAGETHNFIVPRGQLENKSLKNVSRVSWKLFATWNETLSANFDIWDESEAERQAFPIYHNKKESPLEFEVLGTDFVVYEDELSEDVGVKYRESPRSHIKNLSVSLKGPEYLSISRKEINEQANITIFSVKSSNTSSIDEESLNLTASAEYDTIHTGEGPVKESDDRASMFDLLISFSSIFAWTISFL